MTPLEFLSQLQIFGKGIAWMSEPVPKAFFHMLCDSSVDPEEFHMVECCLDWLEYEFYDYSEDEDVVDWIRGKDGSDGMHTSIDDLIPDMDVELFNWLVAGDHQFYVNDALDEQAGPHNIARAVAGGMFRLATEVYSTTLYAVIGMFDAYYEPEEEEEYD